MFKVGDEVVLTEMVAPFTEGKVHSILGVDLHDRIMYVIEFQLEGGKTWEIIDNNSSLQKK